MKKYTYVDTNTHAVSHDLSAIFPGYTRNDGARVNFDITINAVSADTADITITFAE